MSHRSILVIVATIGLAVAMGAALAASGCSAARPTCAVVDLAHSACELVPVQYLAPDGTLRTELVPREEIHAAAVRAAHDAGAE